MLKCPGQDNRFWTPEDTTEIACRGCGTLVEFFKTDALRRCPQCGVQVTNPKVALGCAQWCAHAQECLGFDPQSGAAAAEVNSVADQLIAKMKAEFGSDQKRITHALRVLESAEQIMRAEGGAPRIVVAAAILHDIGIQEAERKHGSSGPRGQELEGPPIARRLLEEAGFDAAEIEHICEIVAHHHSGGVDTSEFRIIWDADQFVNLTEDPDHLSEERAHKTVEKIFKTETGKQLARRWLASQDVGSR
jgi:HD superfamily phosphodiesterase/DNA-directed RNA polymerase subunit RPC12/RpoP